MEKRFDWVIVGCGYTGLRLAKHVAAATLNVLVCRRSQEALDRFGALGPHVTKRACDKANLDDVSLEGAVVVDCAPPSVEQAEAKLVLAAKNNNAKRLIYVSSTGVYSAGGGDWVDETHPLEPIGVRGQKRLRAENEIRKGSNEQDLAWNVLRVPAIYGPFRGVHDRLRRKQYRPLKTNTVVSRIHVDDLVKAIWEVGNGAEVENEIFNVADYAPERSEIVCKGICDTLGIEFPGFRSLETVDADKRSMFLANRKVSNQKIIQALKFKFEYPSWKEGVAQCLREESAENK